MLNNECSTNPTTLGTSRLSSPSPLSASSIITSSLSDCGMEPLEKLEIIVKLDLAEKKRKRESTNHSSNLYVLGLDHEISMLEEIVFAINAIKLNHYSVSDEMISKMFCSG